MNDPFFSKDTLFNDLPPKIKQKIINTRNLSMAHRSSPQALPITQSLALFDHIAVPSSSLYDVFVRMAQAMEKPESLDATENLKKELADFMQFIGFYKLEANNTDFIGELEKTIGMLESKYEKLIN